MLSSRTIHIFSTVISNETLTCPLPVSNISITFSVQVQLHYTNAAHALSYSLWNFTSQVVNGVHLHLIVPQLRSYFLMCVALVVSQ